MDGRIFKKIVGKKMLEKYKFACNFLSRDELHFPLSKKKRFFVCLQEHLGFNKLYCNQISTNHDLGNTK